MASRDSNTVYHKNTHTHTPRGGVPGHASVLPQDSPAQVEQDIVEALLLSAFGGQLQDLRVAVKQLAGVAGRRRRLHLVAGQHPHLHTCLVERLDGVRRFFLEPVVMEKAGNEKRQTFLAVCKRFVGVGENTPATAKLYSITMLGSFTHLQCPLELTIPFKPAIGGLNCLSPSLRSGQHLSRRQHAQNQELALMGV